MMIQALGRRSPLSLCALLTLGISACGDDPPPPEEDMGADLDMAEMAVLDQRPSPDLCVPEDLSDFCQDKCGIYQVPCMQGQEFDCGLCDPMTVQIIEPSPPSGQQALELSLGQEPVRLVGQAVDAQGSPVACELRWSVIPTDATQRSPLARLLTLDEGPALLPITQGEIDLEAACGQVKTTLRVRMTLPGYSANPTAHKLWLRPEAGLESSQGRVTAWRNTITDQPGFVASSMERAPSLIEAGPGGFPALGFDGSQGLQTKALGQLGYVAFRQRMTLFVVARSEVARLPSSQFLIGGCRVDGEYQLRMKANESNTLVYYHLQRDQEPDQSFTREVNPTRLADGLVVLTVQADEAALRVRLNGQPVETREDRILGQGRAFHVGHLGAWCDGAIGLRGQIVEVLGFEDGFADAERAVYRDLIERYLMNKYMRAAPL